MGKPYQGTYFPGATQQRDVVRTLNFVAALMLLTPAALAAQEAPPRKPPEQVTVTGELPAKSKLVCERFVPTGSIKSQKICRTQAESDQMRADSLAELQRLGDEQQQNRQWQIRCQFLDMC